VKEVLARGDTKATVIHADGVQVDLEILPREQYGSLLQHFTGSKEHNVALRTWGVEHGFSISEHGDQEGW
jgi:DNA polymerase (family 10)